MKMTLQLCYPVGQKSPSIIKSNRDSALACNERYFTKKSYRQPEAISRIVDAIKMHRTGLIDPSKPIGSFLFLGPTGVGKTEVARI